MPGGETKVAAWLFTAAALFAALPAQAYIECESQALLGADIPESVHQKLSVTVEDAYFGPRTILQRHLNFGTVPNNGRRFFTIGSSGPPGGRLTTNYITFNFPSGVRPDSRYLFAFLTLDSGEYVQRMIMDPARRQWSDFEKKLSSRYPVTSQITASFNVTDRVFLDAFAKAKIMAIELKYADGETLVREAYDMTTPQELVDRTIGAAYEKYRNRKGCREWIDLEF